MLGGSCVKQTHTGVWGLPFAFHDKTCLYTFLERMEMKGNQKMISKFWPQFAFSRIHLIFWIFGEILEDSCLRGQKERFNFLCLCARGGVACAYGEGAEHSFGKPGEAEVLP